MAVIVWPLLIAIIGFFMRAFIAHPEIKNLGEVMLWCGAFWVVYLLTGSTFVLGGKD